MVILLQCHLTTEEICSLFIAGANTLKVELLKH